MKELQGKRVRRKPQEIAAEIDEKIGKQNEAIAAMEEKKKAYDEKIAAARTKIAELEKRKEEVLTPKPPKKRVTKKQKLQSILKKAEKSGLKPEEIAERLGISLDE